MTVASSLYPHLFFMETMDQLTVSNAKKGTLVETNPQRIIAHLILQFPTVYEAF